MKKTKKKFFKLILITILLSFVLAAVFTGCTVLNRTGVSRLYTIYLMDGDGWVLGYDSGKAYKLVNVNNDACDRIYNYNGRLYIASGKGWGSDKPGEIIMWNPQSPGTEAVHLEPADGASVWSMVFISETKAYATLSNDTVNSGGVWIFNPSDLTEGATLITGTEGGNPEGIILVGSYAYVAYSGYGSGTTVKVINTLTDTVTATITVGTNPQALVASSDGSRVYVANTGSYNSTTYSYENCSISVIDTSTNTVISTITMADGTGPSILAITEDGKLYTTGYGASVYVIDTAATTPTPVAITTEKLCGASMLIIGDDLYITNPDYTSGSKVSTLTIIDTTTNSEKSGSPVEVGDVDTKVSGITTYSQS